MTIYFMLLCITGLRCVAVPPQDAKPFYTSKKECIAAMPYLMPSQKVSYQCEPRWLAIR